MLADFGYQVSADVSWFLAIKFRLMLADFWLSSFGPLVILLQKTIKLFDFPIFWPWDYQMKVTPETRCAHSIRYQHFY